MGLFSSILHLRLATQLQALEAIDTALARLSFAPAARLPVPPEGPGHLAAAPDAAVQYLVSADSRPWLTIIESQPASPPAPWLADLGKAVSATLGCFALAFHVHDDDVLLYDLDHRGASLDGYNSCPQYFENDRLADEFIESQRHSPEAFAPVLPHGVTPSDLSSVLNKGWWAAYDAGRLDDDGVPIDDDDDPFLGAEGDRLTALGTILQLSGSQPYPYAAWAAPSAVRWPGWVAATFVAER